MSDIDIPDGMNEHIEPEHVEMVFDGFMDTIDGNEGMNLTSAQVYLNGVMRANGMMSRHEYAGNEGIFQSIGDALNKVWEYIVKMFKSIFGGEKKKTAETQTKKLDDKIESVEKKVQKAASNPVSEIKTHADLDKFMGAAERKVEKAPESQAKKDLEKDIKETKEKINDLHAKADKAAQNMGKESYKDFMLPELRAALENIVKNAFKVNLYNKQKAIEASGRLKASVEKLQLIKGRYEKANSNDHLPSAIQRYVGALAGLDPIENVKDIDSALSWVGKAKRCKDAMGDTWITVFNTQDGIKRQITELEGKLNHFDKSADQDPLKKEITELKERLSDIINVDNHFGVISVSIANMIDTIEKAFVEV